MKELEKKYCFLKILTSENRVLFYSRVLVVEVTNTHISFIDKYNRTCIFPITAILEAKEENGY